jgi:hypothetical protein
MKLAIYTIMILLMLFPMQQHAQNKKVSNIPKNIYVAKKCEAIGSDELGFAAMGLVPFSIFTINPADPNEVIGPSGYDTSKRWVSINAPLKYKVLFENDPDFATAPAQRVVIYLPIHPNLNPGSIQLGEFGFGNFIFSVPANTNSYTNRLDVKDSLGVLVDVTAGLDFANRRAFWIFQSIDPATGLSSTLPADGGFLPVNDTTIHNGEGFVTLTLVAASDAQTRDTATAKASIIFDTEDVIETNVWINTIDALAPTSKVNSLPAVSEKEFAITWAGKDDSLGVGLQSYDLYVSKNGSPFSLYREKTDSTFIRFTGEPGISYSFFTLASDFTGNREAMKTTGDQSTTVRGSGLWVSAKAFLQGAYDASAGSMYDSLRAKDLLPVTDPYPNLSFNHKQNSIVAQINAGVLDSTGNKAIVDWVWLELRNSTNQKQVSATRAALIRRDGIVVDMDGESPVYFNNIPEGSYHLALRHRNHFGVMTTAALTLTSKDTTAIDFTSPATAVYGTDAMKNQSGVMLLWGGDANGDGVIRYNGANNDKNAVLAKVGLTTSNNVLTLYDRTDVNMDGLVRYNGANNDKNFILGVLGLMTPARVITEQLPH